MLKDLPFGVEIEMTGLTREQAAKAAAQLWNTTARHTGRSYDTWEVKDPEGASNALKDLKAKHKK